MKRSMYISIILVAMVLGLLITFQFRTTSIARQGIPAGRSQELAVELNQLDAEKLKLQNEIADLESKLIKAEKGQEEMALKSELTKAKIAAGMVAVSGPGIEIIMDNPSVTTEIEKPVSLFVIRDEDLLRVVNELRGAGAEAISINGQRIVATSEIRWAAPFINVNLTRLVPPYHILAIGNPDYLEIALNIPGGIVEYLRDLGVRIDIQVYDKLTIPAYVGRS